MDKYCKKNFYFIKICDSISQKKILFFRKEMVMMKLAKKNQAILALTVVMTILFSAGVNVIGIF